MWLVILTLFLGAGIGALAVALCAASRIRELGGIRWLAEQKAGKVEIEQGVIDDLARFLDLSRRLQIALTSGQHGYPVGVQEAFYPWQEALDGFIWISPADPGGMAKGEALPEEEEVDEDGPRMLRTVAGPGSRTGNGG